MVVITNSMGISLTKATDSSKIGRPCRVRTQQAVEVESDGQNIRVRKPDEAIIEFDTKSGKSYVLTGQN